MVFGLFRSKPKTVKVKRKPKAQKPKVKKKATAVKAKKRIVKKVGRVKKALGPKAAMPQVVGKVTHYFPHVKAGVILVTKGKIVPGDTLHIKGYTTDFKQKVSSMEIDNVPVKTAVSGQEIGLLVKSRVRHHDVVYKL